VEDIKQDVQVIVEKMTQGVPRYLIVQAEKASDNYDTDFVRKIFAEEGKDQVV
jgi:6-phosphofructokinase 1